MHAQPGLGPSASTPGQPKRDGKEKETRTHSIGEWVSTTQGIIVIIATLIGLIVGGSVVVVNINVPGKTSSTPNSEAPNGQAPNTQTSAPQTLTVDQVKAALLMPTDLASIDPNLTYKDVALPRMGSCAPAIVKPLINVSREFTDGINLTLGDEIEIFSSANAAHVALAQDSQQATCSLTPPYSTSNISSQLNGMCAENYAMNVTEVNDNNADVSGYFGIVRCGRALVFFSVAALRGSSFDSSNNLVNGMEIAIPKVQSLL